MRQLPGFIFISALLSACSGSSGSGTPLLPAERIIGTERLGWNQTAATADLLPSLRFIAYVDDVRSEMQEVSCDSNPGPSGFSCSGRLPEMSAGRHTLRLATIGGEGSSSESAPSAPLTVIVVTSTISSLPVGPLSSRDRLAIRVVTTPDRVGLTIETVLTGLDEPTDIAFLADGRMLIAERGGSVRIARVGRPADRGSDSALALDDVETRTGGGLLAIAPDPRFDRNGYVYAVYTTARGFRLARFREAGDRLGDRVVLLEGIPATRVPPAATLRFGPDDKLYLGVDDGGDARRAGDLGSYNGKLLRFNPDATTPSDQAGGSPVHALDVNAPRGLAWGATGGSIWIAQGGPAASSAGELRAFVRPPRDRTGDQRARVVARYLLPEGTRPSPIAIYRAALIPEFRGDLLMAAGDRGGLLRMKFEGSDPLKVISTDRLFDDGGERVRAIAVGGEGAIYIATSTSMMKIAPAGTAAAVQ